MKKILIVLIILGLAETSFAQNPQVAKKLVRQGVKLHDQKEYAKAIKLYDKALKADKNNLAALAEKAFSQISIGKNKACIKTCKKAILTHPKSSSLKYVYVTYGNALDAIKKPKKAIEIYDEGIKSFPNFYHIYYNKGITQAGMRNFDDAILSFQKSATLNPRHASSHNALGSMLSIKKMKIPALLAYSRFLSLESYGHRAKINLPILKSIMKGNVKKNGRKGVTISIDGNMFKNKKEGDSIENDFSSTEFMLALTAGLDLDGKKKKKNEVEIFMSDFETICSSLSAGQSKNYGFYWTYYVPYFVELEAEGHLEAFSYLAYSPSEKRYITKWLKKNEDKVKSFIKWSSKYEWNKEN